MHYLGVDVAKANLETSDAAGRLRRTFRNNLTGIGQLVRWVHRSFAEGGVLVVLEPTSTYHQLLVKRLQEARIAFNPVNPSRSRKYAASLGLRAKTDRVDAQMLAKMGESQQLGPASGPDEGQERLKALRRHLGWLEDEARAASNRLEAAEASPWDPASVSRSLRKTIKDLKAQADAMEKEIGRMVNGDERLSASVRLLTSVPGVGLKTATLILSELPPAQECKSARSWAAFCGVCPEPRQSGAASYSVLSRAGSSRLRADLYMAAVSAMHWNPAVEAYMRRLAARGKTGKRAVMAAMNKLLRICFGVLRNGRPFDPQLHLKYA